MMILAVQLLQAKEWKSIGQYRRHRGTDELAATDWLKKDRKRNTLRWHATNLYNLSQDSGYIHYNTFAQKRDFYKWMDDNRFERGHEVKWEGWPLTQLMARFIS